ncbi:LacI family DNA-binding transcriptional regulator [Arsenicitalea aurantiaca]|uniref:LacI family DNA-binding transcriptional regulator n=2 Tax=Arsenicitalea aurantiaca TaxID=1783274 RepID=A0A433XGI3_9HYPH|nr:LacI family DNA-binding transcriptional regulator [Arsenicitalea aurantiaca]
MAGVSEITASRVMRDRGPIRAETRDKVLRAVAATGYVRNGLAGSLASARSNLVGVILPSHTNNVFPEVMAGIGQALSRSGYQPVVGVTDYDPATEEALVRSLLAWKPAAMILTGLEHTRETRRMLETASIRVAEIMDIDNRPIDLAIGFSHLEAGRASARHLLARGYRRIGYVGHDLDADLRAAARLKGLVDQLGEAGAPLERRHLTGGASSVQRGRSGLGALLAQHPDCDVVVFSNDDMAVGGVFHAMAEGMDVPGRLGLFGCNGLDIGQALPKPLSTLRANRQRIGEIAVERIVMDDGPETGPAIIDVGFEIVAGATA